MGSSELLDHLLGADREHDADDEIVAAHLTLYRQYWGRLAPLPGARELLRSCAERGLQVVLASSASEDELAALRGALGAEDEIAVTTSAADAEQAKPAPDLLQAALNQAGLAPDRVVFVGDAVWDGAAAAKAGVTFVGLTCGGTPESELREAGAAEVWRDPAHLHEHLDESCLGGLTRSG
jgi:HAD superfamily hydrolase (TIGR01509 family)